MTTVFGGICCQANCRVPASLDAGRPPSRQAWQAEAPLKINMEPKNIQKVKEFGRWFSSSKGVNFRGSHVNLSTGVRVHDCWIFSPSFEVNQVTQMISIDFRGCHWSSRRRCCRCSSTRARKAAAVAGENAYISLVLTNIHQTKLFTLFGACYHYSTYPPSSCSSSHKVINVLTVPYSFYCIYSCRIWIL